jgi:hypothetical protein
MPEARAFLRHAVATVAYRGGKAVRDAPPTFADLPLGERCRTPVQILAHIGDLFDWALGLAKGRHVWHDSPPLDWDREVERFFAAIAKFDAYLASGEPIACPPERLFQGPVADALTHIGQIAMMRRLAGAPVRGENYYTAEIEAGRVGPEQSARRVEFD